MPSPFYNTEGRFGWRKLLGTSKVHDIGVGINALGTDIEGSLETKRSIIATEQSRENTTYGTLATPDEVTVVLPENGLIAIAFMAMWEGTSTTQPHAAIFLGANQLQYAAWGASPKVQEAIMRGIGSGAVMGPLATRASGLVSGENVGGYTGHVTTGQIVGASEVAPAEAGKGEADPGGGPCYVFAAAGTYKITVQYKVASGKVVVKNRKLWAWVVA